MDISSTMKKILLPLALFAVSLTAAAQKPAAKPAAKTSDLVAQHLKTFDELDYDVFSNEKWDRLHESHAQNILVHWPDGHTTTGIQRHISDLKAMFVYAPDTQIKQHPLKLGQGNLTAVAGVMTGTFTKPMPTGDGKFIQPNGKKFSLPMSTIGVWKDGVMVEEYLYWDNQSYMKQLGLAK